MVIFVKKKKICVYTCITGNYDNLMDIDKEAGVDYYCFTNNKNLTSNSWEIVYISDDSISNVKLARKIKILGHDLINDNYDILLWMDGAVSFRSKIIDFIDYYYDDKYDMVAFKHGERDTILEECVECAKVCKETTENIVKLLDFYKKEKFIDSKGLIESTVFIKNGRSKKMYKAMKLWFDMILKYSHRDQLSFNYVLSKVDLNINWIEEKVFDNKWFDWKNHGNNRVLHNYRVYFGDETNFSFYNNIVGKYSVKEDDYVIECVAPVSTNSLTIYFSNIPVFVLKKLLFNGKKEKLCFENIYKKNGYYYFYDEKPVITMNKKIVKGRKIRIDLFLDILNENEIAKLLKEQSMVIECKNKEIDELKSELKMIYESKGWKYLQSVRKVLRK